MSDIRIIDHIEDITGKRIVIYGASGSGKKFQRLLNMHGLDVDVFCDSNETKWGSLFEGRKVISPQDLKKYVQEKDCFVIICSVFLKEIYTSLKEIGIDESKIVSEFAVRLGLHRYTLLNEKPCNDLMLSAFRLRNELYQKTGDESYHFSIYFTRQNMIDFLKPDQECVFAYQPAKVGSTTIFQSLQSAGYYTVHFHNISGMIDRNEMTMEEWYEILSTKVKLNGKVKIVTGVREPLARDLSHFFQALQSHDYMMYDVNCSFEQNIDLWMEFCISDEKKQCYPEQYRYWNRNVKYGIEFDWYFDELKRFFGIDIFSKEFDKTKGYQIYENEYAKVFVYQLEKLKDLEGELKKFLANDKFCLKNANDSGAKKYWKLYQETKREYKVKDRSYDFYYKDNPGVSYFYEHP